MNTVSTKEEHLCFNQLYISKTTKQAIYFGYRLILTKSEYHILMELVNENGSPISAEEIAARTGSDMSKENVAFHVSSINKKAKRISNRILVKNIAKIGYFLA